MSSLLALLGGASAKLYDDLEDNILLQKHRNSTLMEVLKGIHFISFISLSIEEPMFFIIQYLCNIVHHFGNKEAYNKPYEHSLLYSFVLLFFIIDYKKITNFCISDKLISILGIIFFALEPLIGFDTTSEYSFSKMICRVIGMIVIILLYYFSISNSLKYIITYFMGYVVVSILVQCYSLRVEKLEAKEEEAKEKVEEKVEEVKEVEVEEEIKEEVKEDNLEVKEEVEEKVKEDNLEVKEEQEEEVKEEVKEEKEEKTQHNQDNITKTTQTT